MDERYRRALINWTEAWASVARLHILQLRRPRTRIWARPMLLERNQNASQLIRSILDEELDKTVINFMRMCREDFAYLLQLVTPRIRKQDTYMRDAITPKDRLIISLRFLASGDSYQSLEYAYRVSSQSISLFVPEVCDSIIMFLRKYVKVFELSFTCNVVFVLQRCLFILQLPSTREEWLKVADDFYEKWQFPHATGAIDGKHVPIKAPAKSDSEYFNYQHFFSIVLLGIVDANCNFMFVDVGCKGRISDGGVLRTSRLHNLLENNRLQIPEAEMLRGSTSLMRIPYMLLGDKAFAFTNNCIRPFGGITDRGSIERIFNERHSKARRTVEMAFGILTARFRVLRTPIELNLQTASKVVLTCVYLLNYIRRNVSGQAARETEHVPSELIELRGITHRTTNEFMQIRLHLANKFADGTI
ncbi:putative nuclease HARBI1 isoform X3 [Anopheles funestus]|uniref:putative nuclease HARBI1 isoform X3 n=1 Tax=Anopheles funestus TaxID=62324 RepID=UPI0020C6492D|nr:putative nuclease HARBI1 isoform X3 [Anopheles funestus]